MIFKSTSCVLICLVLFTAPPPLISLIYSKTTLTFFPFCFFEIYFFPLKFLLALFFSSSIFFFLIVLNISFPQSSHCILLISRFFLSFPPFSSLRLAFFHLKSLFFILFPLIFPLALFFYLLCCFMSCKIAPRYKPFSFFFILLLSVRFLT